MQPSHAQSGQRHERLRPRVSDMSNENIFQTATLIDKAYNVVMKVSFTRRRSWPEAIRYDGRVFTHHPVAMLNTIEADRAAELAQTYREIEVFEIAV
jgi:hypothetical protein